jgi:hypothetical protein
LNHLVHILGLETRKQAFVPKWKYSVFQFRMYLDKRQQVHKIITIKTLKLQVFTYFNPMRVTYCICVLYRLGVFPEDDPHGIETYRSLKKF